MSLVIDGITFNPPKDVQWLELSTELPQGAEIAYAGQVYEITGREQLYGHHWHYELNWLRPDDDLEAKVHATDGVI